ncbi:MAG: galactose mutarotase, partial [Saprospiraceae bacterium]|nr:galactose mutarotase [Saprospiraceae bacterium]
NYMSITPIFQPKLYNIHSESLRCILSDWGARLISFECKSSNEDWVEITGGYDNIQDYRLQNNYFGSICGRYANRIKNGQFVLDGKLHQLDINKGHHHLHGGRLSFHNQIWTVINHTDTSIEFQLHDPDSHQGYPGNLISRISYEVRNNELLLQYSAQSDLDTIINIAPHFYFNLSLEDTIYNHELWIDSDTITEITDEGIPTGKFISTENSSLDFSVPKKIMHGFATDDLFIRQFDGYDYNFVLKSQRNFNSPVASVYSQKSNLQMNIYTSQPGLQFYTCNWKDKFEIGRGKRRYGKHSFLCLESQHFPDSPNHDHFPSTVLRKNEFYKHFTRYELLHK